MRRGKQKQKKGLNEFLFRLGRMKEDKKFDKRRLLDSPLVAF